MTFMTGPTDAALEVIERLESGRPCDDAWSQLTDDEKSLLDDSEAFDETEIPWAD